MQAQDFLKEGDLSGALSSAMQAVRDDPAKAENRTLLFQLLSITGDWDRSLTQLNVAGELDTAALPMVQTYREALGCEALRERVFAGSRSPLIFGDPEQWIALALEAVKLSGQGKHAEATTLREQAYELVPGVPGTVNGEAFEWLADADSRIGPFVEAIIDGKYYWVPMHRIASLTIEAPEDLRDLVWIPAHFSWGNGGQSIALLPVRYPETHASSNDSLRLSRLTEWDEVSADTFFGVGQRMMATDQADYSLLDMREIVFTVDAPESDGD
jgi:type VI secretion system protein ImpE